MRQRIAPSRRWEREVQTRAGEAFHCKHPENLIIRAVRVEVCIVEAQAVNTPRTNDMAQLTQSRQYSCICFNWRPQRLHLD